MKLFVATSLLVGYVMLVPLCFFGSTLTANADTMRMLDNPAHQMSGCAMQFGGCAHSTGVGGIDSVAHHVDMYNSITQTPLVALSVILASIMSFLLVVLGLFYGRFHVLRAQSFLRPLARRTDEQRSNARYSTLTWLSLFETSPNFA